MGWGDDITTPQHMRGYRLAVFSQLRQAIEAMHSPEEMFRWLSSMIMQRFDVPIVQIWTCENGWSGQPSPSARLRAMASQHPSQPLQVLSEKTAEAVERIARGQRITSPVPVERIFPPYLASLLKRYGLGICLYCVNSKNVALAPEGNVPMQAMPSTGLTFIVLLLLSQFPQQDVASAVTIILEQALAIAENRRLLLPVTSAADQLSAPMHALTPGTPPALPGLIIKKKQNAGFMLSSNPFASSVTITDKQAQRLFEVIDGRTPMAELAALTGMTLQEAQLALQTLLGLQCVEIYTQEGWPVDTSLLFKNR